MSCLANSSSVSALRTWFGRKSLAPLLAAAVLASASQLAPSPAFGQTNPLYWDTTTGTWDTTATNWVNPDGSPATNGPTSGNDVVFNYSGVTAANETVSLSAPQSVMGLYFTNTDTTLLQSLTTSETLSLGADGINIASTAGAVTLGSTTAANALPISITGSQIWTNNSTATTGLTVVNGISETGTSTLTIAGTGNTTLSGAITNGTGTLGLLMAGSGMLTLGGANSFTGGMTISSGTVALNTNTAGGASTGTITLGDANTGANNIQLTLNNLSDSARLTNPIAVSASGSGTVTILGTNANGEADDNIVLNRATTLSSSAASGGFYFNYSGIGSISGNVGTLTLTNTGAGKLYMNGTNTFAGTVDLPTGTVYTFATGAFGGTQYNPVVMSGTGSLGLYNTGLTIGGLTGASTNTINTSANGNNTLTVSSATTAEFDGAISGGGGVTLIGPGNETLGGTDTFTGATTLTGGTLTLGNSLALQDSTLTLNGGTLSFGTLSAATVGGLAGTQNLSLTNASSAAVALTVGGGNDTASYSQFLSGTGSSLIKTGTGTQTLSGANSYDSGTTISGGVLEFTVPTAMPAAGTVAVNAGGTLGVAVGGGGQFTNASTSTAGSIGGLLAGIGGQGAPVTFASGSFLGIDTSSAPGGSLTYAGNITNSGLGINKLGTGTLVLPGANTYTGGTTVTAGTLQIAGSGLLGSAGTYAGAIVDNGTLEYSSSATQTFSNTISGTGALVKDTSTSVLTLSAANSYSGGTTINAGTLQLDLTSQATTTSLNLGTFTVNPSGTLQLSILSGTGTALMNTGTTFTGAGTIVVTAGTADVDFWSNGTGTSIANFTGLIDVKTGTLSDQTTSNWSTSAGFMTLEVESGAYFDLRTDSPVVNMLTGSGIIGSSYNSNTLTVGNQNGSSTFSGVIQNTVPFAYNSRGQVVGLTKTGTGTLALNGSTVSTYTGATTVSAGTLLLDFSNLASPTNLLSSSSALKLGGGTLRINGNSSAATAQTLASLSLTAGTSSSIVLDPNGVSPTTLTITSGTLTTGAGSALNFNYSAGSTVGATVGNDIVAFGTAPVSAGNILGGAYTVTDSGGTGFAEINASKQVIRLTDPGSAGLPTSTGSPTTNYFINQNYSTSSTSTPGSLVEAPYGGVAANSITVDTTGLASGANLALGANTLTLTSGGGMLFTGANPYSITATSGDLTASAASGSLVFTNDNSSTVTIIAPILDNSTTAVTIAGTGTTLLGGANTYTGGTSLTGDTLSVAHIADSGISNLGDTGALTLGGGTLLFTGVGDTTARNLAITAPSTIDVAAGGTLAFVGGTNSGGGGLTFNGPGTLTLKLNSNGQTDRLHIGTTATDIGPLTVNAGTLNVTNTYIVLGETGGGSAQFTINGGTVFHNTVTGGLYLDNATGANSVMTINGGAYVDGGHLNLGETAGFTATFNLNAGTAMFAAGGSNSPIGINGTGIFNQTGGSSYFVDNINGSNGSGTATMNLSGGTLLSIGTMYTGVNSAGTLNISGSAFVFPQAFSIYGNNQTGTVNVSGGELYVAGNNAFIGQTSGGTSTFNQTGGTTVFTYQVLVAAGSGSGTMNLSGGLFEQTSGDFFVGFATGPGTLNVSGTALASLNNLSFDYTAASTGTVNLNGGTLRIFGESYGASSTGGTGTFNFNGGTLQVAAASISTPSQVANVVQSGGAVIDTQNYTYTVTSPFTAGAGSSGGLTKYGGGTLALTSAAGSTYTGATAINGGTLLANFSNMTTPTNLLPSGSALNLSAGSTLNLEGQSGAVTAQTLGNLTLNSGGGTILFTPNSSTSTTLTLGNTWTNNNNSTLLVDESATGTSVLASNPATSLNANGFVPWATVKTSGAFGFASVSGGNVVPFVPLGGTLPGASAGSSTDYSLSGASASQTVTASETADSLTIAPTAASQSLAINAGQVLGFTAGAVAFDGSTNAYSITGPGQFGASGAALTLSTYGANALTISAPVKGGAGSLILGGAGKTILSGTNTYSGGTQLNSGTLSLGSTTALGSGTLTIDGGTLDSSVASLVNGNNNAQAWNGNFAFAGSNALNLGTGNVTLGANVQINTSASGTTTPLTIAGNISGSYGLAKVGTGVLVLSGSNTYTGTTTLSQGYLQLSSTTGYAIPGNFIGNNVLSPKVYATANNQFAPGSVMYFVGTGGDHVRFELLGTTQTLAGIDNSASSGMGVIQNYEQAPIANSGAGQLILNGSGNYFYNGYLRNATGTISLTYNGTGTQVLSGGNITYTGPTVVNSGTLELYGTGGFNSPTTVNAGATLSLFGGNSNDTIASITLNGGSLADNANGNQTDEGAVVIAAPSTITITNSGSNNQFFFDGGLSGSGQTLTINNYGNTTTGESFRNNNGANFTGPVIVNGGEINIANSAATALAYANLTLNNAILDLGITYGMSSASGATLASLGGNGTVTAGGSTVTLTVGNTGGSGSFSGTLTNGSGTLSLTKTGSGTQTLNGWAASSYTGATTVAGGTLVLDLSNIPTSTNLLSTSSPLTLGGGTLELLANSTGPSAQTLASLSTAAGTNSSIALNPNGGSGTTLTITSGTLTTGAGSTVNFNYSAGTTNGATVGNDIVSFGTSPVAAGTALGGGYTVTDTGGFGFAEINSSKQVVRLVDLGGDGLPTSGGSPTTSYFVNQNYSTSSTSTPGSLVEALSGGVAANTVSIDTTGVSSGANLALGANTLTLTAGGGILFTGANPYAITATSGSLTSSASGSITFDNYNSSTVTISAPILDNSGTSVTIAGTGTTVLGGANTYTGGTYLDAGTLVVSAIADSGTSNLGPSGLLSIGGGATLEYTGAVAATTARAFNLTAGGAIFNITNPGGSLTLTSSNYTTSGLSGGGLTKSGLGTLTFGTLLDVGNGTNETGPLTINAGTFNANGTSTNVYVGNAAGVGTATFTQTGGTFNNNTGEPVYVGYAANAPGVVNLSGGTFNTTGVNYLYAGYNAPATINVSGNATLNLGNQVWLGYGNSANGTAVLNLSGNAVINQTGTSYLVVGNNTLATYNQTGGTFTISGGATTYVANGTGPGVMNISGGVFATNGPLVLGERDPGTINLSGGSFVSGYGSTNDIGNNGAAAATGTWNQTGGTAYFANQLNIANGSGASSLNVSGGTFYDISYVYVGVNGAGMLNISNNAFVFPQGLSIYGNGQSGTVNVTGGELYVAANTTYIGQTGGGTSTFNQTSGTTVFTNQVLVAAGTGSGTLNLSGGLFEETAGNFYLGFGAGAGTLNVSGAALVSLNSLSFAYTSASNGTLNLNGGTLRIFGESYGVSSTGGTGTFNFNGGTLQIGASISTPSQVSNVIQSGGAVIDTQNYTFTVTSPFTAGIGSTGGLTKYGGGTLALTSAAGSTYAGPTTLNGGTLLANFSNMTSPTNLLPSGSALNLNAGSTLNLEGQASAVTAQTLGNLTLNSGGGTILFTPNSSTSTTLTLGATWTANNNSTLLIDESATGTSVLASNPSAALNLNGFIPWATVKTSAAFGFASISGGTTIVPFVPVGGALPGASADSSTDYSISANQTVTASETADSLTITPGGPGQSLAINAGQVLGFGAGAVAFDGSSQAFSITGPGQFGGSGFALTLSTYGANALTISAPVKGGTGRLILGGTGKTILSGTNTYSGGTQLNSGTLSLGSATALGTGTLTIDGGTLDSNVANLLNVNNNAEIWNGNFTFAGSNALNLGTGAVTLGANVQINASASGTSTPLTVAGNISGSYGLAKVGAGVLVLSGSNTYTGTTTLSGGLLQLSSTTGYAIPGNVVENGTTNPAVYTTANNQFAPGSAMYFVGSNHAYFELLGTTQTLAGLDNSAVSGYGVIENYQPGFTPSSISSYGYGELVFNGSGNYFYNGIIRDQSGAAGTIGLTYNGTGTQILSGNSITYTGRTVVNSGTLELYNTSAFNSATTVNAGATLSLYGGTTNDTSAPIVMNGGTLTDSASGYQTDEGAVVIAVPTTFTVTNSGASNQFFFDAGLYGSGQTLTFNNYGNTTTGETFRAYAATGGAQSGLFSGSVIVNGGQIAIGQGNASAALALANADLTLNNATLALGTNVFALTATGATLHSLNGNGSVSAAGSTVTLAVGNNGGTGSFSGTLVNGGGTLSLTKIGSGTQTLNGPVASTYTGTTTVAAGTLVLDMSNMGTGTPSNMLSSSSALTLGGGTLRVLGVGAATQSLGALTLSNGGGLAVANQGGSTTLTLASLTALTGGQTLNVDLSSGSGTNTLTFTSTTNLPTAGTLIGWATVTDATGTGFATLSGNNIIRYTGPTTALTASNSTASTGSTDFTTNPSTDGYAGGTLALTSTSPNAADSLNINAAAPGTLDLGGGNLTFTSGGLLMSGVSNYTIQNGQLGASGAELDIHQTGAGTLTVSAAISDNGSPNPATILAKSGSGTLVLTGANTYSGATNINGGTLQIGNGGANGALGTGPVANGGTLIYDLTGTTSWANTITGAGSLTLNGGGALTLTGATSSYTGPTTINSGSLFLNGSFTSFASSITANSGTTLQINNTLPAAAGITLNDATLQLLTASATVNSITINGTSAGSTIAVASGKTLTSTTGLFGTNQNVTIDVSAGSSTQFALGNVGNFSGTLTVKAGSGSYFGVNSAAVETALINTDLILNGTGSTGVAYAGAALYIGNNATGNFEVRSLTGNAASSIDTDNTQRIIVLGTDNTTTNKTTFAGDTWGNNSTTFDQVGFVKNGTYTQEFSGPNIIYNSVTTLNNGTLEFTDTTGLSNNTTYGITLDPVNAVTLQLNANAANWTLTKAVSGGSAAASVTKLGPDILTMNAQNTYTAPTTLAGGELKLGVAETPGTSGPLGDSAAINPGNIVFAGGTLQYSTSNQFDYSGRFSTAANQPISIDTNGQNVSFATPLSSNGGTLTKLGSGTLSLLAPETYTGLTTITTGTLQFGNGTSGNDGSLVATGGINNNATLAFNIFGIQTYSGAIGGSGAVTNVGPGTQILSGLNTYSGGTNVSAGTLLANGSATSISSSTGTGGVTVTGGSLGGTGAVLPTGSNRTVSIQDGGTIVGTAGQTLTINGILSLAANASSSSSIATFTPGAAGAAALIAANSLMAPASGTAYIDITNSASLATGTYDLISYTGGPSAAIPAADFGFTSGVTFASGDMAALVTTGSQLDLVVVAPVTWTGAAGSPYNWNTTSQNWATAALAPTLYSDGDPVTFADNSPLGGQVPNSGSPNFLATVTIPGTVSPGSITFTNTGVAHGGVDYLITGSGSIAGAAGITLNGSGGVGGNVYLATANTFSGTVGVYAGQLILENNAALGATPSVTVGSNAALGLQTTTGGTPGSFGSTASGYSTTLTGSGPAGNGALVSITGANTYTGAISIANSGATIGSLSSASGDGLTITGGIAGTATIGITQTLAFAGAGNTTVSSAITDGSGGGKLGLTMSGSGTSTLTLTAANTYTGPTQINSGKLLVAATGSLSANSAVTVGGEFANDSPTLSGGGTIAGPVEVSGTGTAGILYPGGFTGSSPTTMHLSGNLTLDNGAALSFNLSSAPDGTGTPSMLNDHISVGGTLSLTNSGTLNINALGGIGTGTYQLIDYTPGSFTGPMSNDLTGWTVVGGNQSQYSYTFSTETNGQFDLIVGSSITSGSGTWTSNANGGSAPYGVATNWSSMLVPNNTAGNYYTATFGGMPGSGTAGNVLLEDSNSNPANFTVGGLIFASSSTPYTIGYQGTGSLTLDNGGDSGGPRVEVDSGAIQPFISANLILADSVTKSTMFTIASGSMLVVNGPISESMTYPGQSITLTSGGTLELDGNNSYSGGTTVNSGILNVALGQDPSNNLYDGNLGTGPLAINDAGSTVNLYNSISIGDLSGTAGGTLTVNVGTLTVNQSNSKVFAGTLSLASGTNLTVASSNNSTLTIAGAPTFTGSNMVNVNSGTLAFDVTSGTPTVGTGVTVAVASGATLQLAGSVSALSAGGTSAAVNNSGTLNVTGTNQTVGVVSGVASVSGPTTYDGNTVVGDGSAAANLTATQILQNSLTINAGSTVTIAPAGDPPAAIPATSGTVASSSAATAGISSSDAASNNDPFTAIQSAISSGAISSMTGQVLENRIAAIERLAAVDPGLDATLLESRVLAVLPASSALSSTDASPIDTDSSLLALDSSSLGSASGPAAIGSVAFAPSASFAGSPAAVPEPSSWMLIAIAGIGLLFAARRRRAVCK